MMGHVHARGVIEDRHGIQVNVRGRRERVWVVIFRIWWI